MVKLRKDLVGVVYFGGKPYKAGDSVPDEFPVGGHVAADGKDHFPQAQEPAGGPQVEPLSGEDQAAAEALGLPVDGLSPDAVRGALAGYEQGRADTLAQAAQGTAYDPGAEGETVEKVNAYLAEHPDEAAAVLAAEAAGPARAGVLGEYLA